MGQWLLHEIQQDHYNGNVWGPYDTREEAWAAADKVAAENKVKDELGPFTYQVKSLMKV